MEAIANDKTQAVEELTDEQWARIDAIIDKYRHVRGGLIPVLQQVQEVVGYLPVNVQTHVADGLNLNPSEVYGVATFYAFFSLIPRGRHICKVCLGTACYVKGGEKIIVQLEKDLKVKPGHATEDRRFTLEGVRCVGACGLAPVVLIDEDVYREVNIMDLPDMLKKYE